MTKVLNAAHTDVTPVGVALCILQKQPNLVYLDWLAARLAEDPGSFFGYRAAVALVGAVRAFGASHREALKQAIETGRTLAREEAKGAKAFKVLNRAERQPLENPQ